jgi:transcriptional regulator with XRE-family HTH domain
MKQNFWFLKSQREMLGLSLEALAAHLNISAHQLRAIERGYQSPPNFAIVPHSTALKISVEEFCHFHILDYASAFAYRAGLKDRLTYKLDKSEDSCGPSSALGNTFT